MEPSGINLLPTKWFLESVTVVYVYMCFRIINRASLHTVMVFCDFGAISVYHTNKSNHLSFMVIRQDIEAKGLSEGILLDRNEWRKLIHVPDRRNSLLVHIAYPKYLGQMA